MNYTSLLSKATAIAEVLGCLKGFVEWVSRFGTPLQIYRNEGKYFISASFK